jgi:hypothetical protein
MPMQRAASSPDQMRILIYIEPAIFRCDPLFFAPHIQGWAQRLVKGHQNSALTWALASSKPLCDLARQKLSGLHCFAIPSWSILSSCGYQREKYSIALFEPVAAEQGIAGEGALAALAAELQAINRAFQPDVVVSTAENSLLPRVFSQARCLWMEQAPFPRQKRRDRIYIDPFGHQLGSAIEKAADQILASDLPSALWPQAEAIWRVMQAPPLDKLHTVKTIQRAIHDLSLGRRVALLILQPQDGLTWEGCLGRSLSTETLLAQWSTALPSGWVGIPLYKSHSRLPESLEASMAQAFPQLTPLPAELSGNAAEWALPIADAVVTVSSSMAGQALISGKQVVVMGRTPLRALAHTCVSALSNPGPTLSVHQRLGLLAFLSNRYTLTLDELAEPNGPFLDHIRALVMSDDPMSYLLDLSDWSPARLARLL